MSWDVQFSKKANKAVGKLPRDVQQRLLFLAVALREKGPVQPDMPNYGKLKGRKETYHCHLKKGKPTFVAVWEVQDKKIKLIEVTYAGTHENAPY